MLGKLPHCERPCEEWTDPFKEACMRVYREKVQICSNAEETFKVSAEDSLILMAFEFFLDCNKDDQIF